MNDHTQNKQLCKIVYFDEDSVTDYIQIVAGGKLEKTTELLNANNEQGAAGVDARAGLGIGGMLKALIGFDVGVSTEASLDMGFSTNQMARNIVKNTILTDFISALGGTEPSTGDDMPEKGPIRRFVGYHITVQKDSLAYVALISPYLSMLKGGAGIQAGEYNIAVEKLDNTIKSAKGYYEFIGENENNTVIFRFNIKAFKNNYKATDLLKMDMSVYAIKVGSSSIDKLDLNSELELDTFICHKDNPDYVPNDPCLMKQNEVETPSLDVYDVLLAGVEAYD